MDNDDASDEDNDFDEDLLNEYLNSSEDVTLEEDEEEEEEDVLTLSMNDVEVNYYFISQPVILLSGAPFWEVHST